MVALDKVVRTNPDYPHELLVVRKEVADKQPQAVAAIFLGRYVLTFEATSVLLLIAAVGGVTLAARRPAPRAEGAVGVFEIAKPAQEISLQAEVIDAETRFDVVRAGHAPDEEGEG